MTHHQKKKKREKTHQFFFVLVYTIPFLFARTTNTQKYYMLRGSNLAQHIPPDEKKRKEGLDTVKLTISLSRPFLRFLPQPDGDESSVTTNTLIVSCRAQYPAVVQALSDSDDVIVAAANSLHDAQMELKQCATVGQQILQELEKTTEQLHQMTQERDEYKEKYLVLQQTVRQPMEKEERTNIAIEKHQRCVLENELRCAVGKYQQCERLLAMSTESLRDSRRSEQGLLNRIRVLEEQIASGEARYCASSNMVAVGDASKCQPKTVGALPSSYNDLLHRLHSIAEEIHVKRSPSNEPFHILREPDEEKNRSPSLCSQSPPPHQFETNEPKIMFDRIEQVMSTCASRAEEAEIEVSRLHGVLEGLRNETIKLISEQRQYLSLQLGAKGLSTSTDAHIHYEDSGDEDVIMNKIRSRDISPLALSPIFNRKKTDKSECGALDKGKIRESNFVPERRF